MGEKALGLSNSPIGCTVFLVPLRCALGTAASFVQLVWFRVQITI